MLDHLTTLLTTTFTPKLVPTLPFSIPLVNGWKESVVDADGPMASAGGLKLGIHVELREFNTTNRINDWFPEISGTPPNDRYHERGA